MLKRETTDIEEIEKYNKKIKSVNSSIRKTSDDLIFRLNLLKEPIRKANMAIIENKIASRYDELSKNLNLLSKKKNTFLKQLLYFHKKDGLSLEIKYAGDKGKITLIFIDNETKKVLHVSHIKIQAILFISKTADQAREIASYISDKGKRDYTFEKIRNFLFY